MILRARYGAAAQDVMSDGRITSRVMNVACSSPRGASPGDWSRFPAGGHMVNLVEPHRYNRAILRFLRGADAPY